MPSDNSGPSKETLDKAYAAGAIEENHALEDLEDLEHSKSIVPCKKDQAIFEDDAVSSIQRIPILPNDPDRLESAPHASRVGAFATRTIRPGGARQRANENTSRDINDVATATNDEEAGNVEEGLIEAQLVPDTELVVAEQVPSEDHKDITTANVKRRSRTLIFAMISAFLVLLLAVALVAVSVVVLKNDGSEEPEDSEVSINSVTNTTLSGESLRVRSCLQSSQELMDALDSYMVNSNASSQVALQYGWPIGSWCVSGISRFSLVFRADRTRSPEFLLSNKASSINKMLSVDIGGWDVSNAVDMEEMFRGMKNLSSDWGFERWNMSGVVSLKATFMDTNWTEESDLSRWDTSNVETMHQLFRWSNVETSLGIESWDTRKVVNMGLMAENSPTFNADISNWDTRSVTQLNKAFMNAPMFDCDISSWNTTSLTDLNQAFQGATSFNQPIGSWDVSKMRTISRIFAGATAFNQPLSDWNLSNAVRINEAFRGASNFSQNLCRWASQLPEDVDVTDMFKDTACPNPSDPVLTDGGPFCYDCIVTGGDN